jgi:hypothetical protein
MRADLERLRAELIELELAAYWLAFLLELELEDETPDRAPQYALAA